jgi:cytochrome c553
MKTTTLFRYGPAVVALALLAGCHRGGHDAPAPKVQATQAAANSSANPPANPAAAQPGAQGGAGDLARQNAGGGEANALGLPGAAAAPAQGQADLQAGQQLATSGAQNGITACAGCHGAQGEGNAAGGFPRIAGQSAAYLGKQLGAYANGARVNPIMQPIAKAMNAVQIRDVSAYYASLGDAPGAAAPGAAAPAATGGAKLCARAALPLPPPPPPPPPRCRPPATTRWACRPAPTATVRAAWATSPRIPTWPASTRTT